VWPLVLLWLAVHAVLLALILGLKFLTAKTVIMAMLLASVAFFLWRQLHTAPRRLPAA